MFVGHVHFLVGAFSLPSSKQGSCQHLNFNAVRRILLDRSLELVPRVRI